MGSSSEDLLLRISGDSAGGQDAVRALTDALTGLSSQLTQSGATANTAGGHVQALGLHSDNAKLSVYQLRSALEETFSGNFEGAVKNLASSIGADLEGGISLASGSMVIAATSAAALAGGLLYLTENFVSAGEASADFAYKTSIGMESVQSLKDAAEIAGGSLDQLGLLIFRMQQRMAESPDAFEKGLDRIHLSMQDLQGLAPDQQFLKIAAAFRANTDESNRAATAVELFSRAGRDAIPLMMKPLGDLVDQMKDAGHVMSKDDTEAAESLGMAWRGLKAEISWATTDTGIGVVHFFQDLATGINSVLFVIDPFKEDLDILGARLQGATPTVKDLTSSLSMQAGVIPKLSDALETQIEVQRDLDSETQKDIATKQKYQAAVEAIVASLEGESRKSGETAAAIQQVIASHTENADVIMRTVGAIDKLYDSGVHVTDALLLWADANRVVKGTVDALHGPLTELSYLIPDNTIHLAEMRAAFDDARESMDNLDSSTNEFNGGITIAGDEMNSTVIPAFATLATDILPQMTAEIQDAEKGFASFSDMAMASVGKLGTELARGLPQLFQSLESGGSVLPSVEHLASSIGSTLGKDAGGFIASALSVSGPVGSAIGTAIGSLAGPIIDMIANIGGPSKEELAGRKTEGAFEQSFGGFQQMMVAVGEAYAAQGKSAQQAQADVLAMFAAEKQGGDAAAAAVAKISGVLNDQQQDTTDLTAAVQRYGFSLNELGPTMQKQQLDAQAQQLLNDWRLLVGSGMDVATVNAHMASSIQDYLTKAKETGQEVPEAMKPVLQSLIDQGKLTDENGNAITDMSQLGVTFSETMTEGFQKVVDKLDQLLQKLGMVPAAITAIPKTFDINGNVTYTDPGPRDQYAAGGGFVTSHGIAQYFGSGGFPGGPRGSDTIPAWLTAGEAVLNKRAVAAAGPRAIQSLNRGGTMAGFGGIVVNVTVEGNVSTERDLAEAISQHMADRFLQVGGSINLSE